MCSTTYRIVEPSDLQVRGCRFKLTHIKTNRQKHVITRHIVVRVRCAPYHERPGPRLGCAFIRRDVSLNPRQGRVFVWEGKDEMCSMMQTRANASGSDPKCVSPQCGRENLIDTVAGSFPLVGCRQDGYSEDVQTWSPHDSAAARALRHVSS